MCALPEYGDSLISDNSQQFSSIWRVREEVSIAATKKSTKVLAYDISYDVKEWPNIVDDIRKETRAPVLGYGHIGDGNLHINICLTEDQSFDDESLFKEVTSKQGSISAEHGVGLRKKQYLHLQKSGVAIEMFRKIKEVFDPHGIMNPYKVIPDA